MQNKLKAFDDGPVCTKCFNTLGVPSRMKIYRFLKDKGENTVGAVVKIAKLTQPTVSYHLKEMRDAGLLMSRKSEFFLIFGSPMPAPNPISRI